MSRYIITSKAFALVACTFLLVAAIGCSPGTPTDPSSTPQNVVVSPNFVRILSTSPKNVDEPNLVSGFTSRVISAEDGGVVTNGRITLEFPPFALSEDTEITIEMLDDGTLGVELGPHGIQFNRPVNGFLHHPGPTDTHIDDGIRLSDAQISTCHKWNILWNINRLDQNFFGIRRRSYVQYCHNERV